MKTRFTDKEIRKQTTHDERRTIRREYINYFLQNIAMCHTYTIRESVRMMEIVKCGASLRNYYPNN